jgi:hypothetical protein
MKMLNCGSIPTVTIKMEVAEIENEGGKAWLREKKREEGKGFYLPVSKSVAKKILVGDSVVAVCVPINGLEFATDTLALSLHRKGGLNEVLFDKGDYLNASVGVDGYF